MSLSNAVAHQVSSSSRSRGEQYFEEGAVTDLKYNDGLLHARVIGNEHYDVLIEAAGFELLSTCTCPHFLDNTVICKHIWATILAADAQNVALVEPGRRRGDITLVAVNTDDLDDEVDDDDDDDWLDDVPVPAKPGGRAPSSSRTAPPWQQWLEVIAASPNASIASALPHPRNAQLLYVIDIDASLAAGTPVVELMMRDRKMNGEWSKPRAARMPASEIRRLPEGPDRQILERLLGARPHYAGYEGAAYGYGELSRFQLRGSLVPELLPLFCANDGCMARLAAPSSMPAPTPPRGTYRSGYGRTPPRPKPAPPTFLPLALDDGPPWRFVMRIARDEKSATYRVEGDLVRDEQTMAAAKPLLVLFDGVVVTETHVARLDHGGAFGWLAALRHEGSMAIPLAARPALIDALIVQPPSFVSAPDDLRIQVQRGEPRPVLQLQPLRHRADRLRAEVHFDYDGLHVPAHVPNPIVRTSDAAKVIRRDLTAESDLTGVLHRMGFRKEWCPDTGNQVPQIASDLLPRVARTLIAEGWQVEAKGVRYRQPAGVSLQVTSGIDWFELDGQVEYGDQHLGLPALLAAAQRGDTFVTLGDGSMGLLPEEWLRTHAPLTRLGSDHEGRVRFKSSQVALLDALLAAQPAVSIDEAFSRARRELAAFEGIAPVDPPATFTGTLRGYQREGLGWLLFLRRFGLGGCLADDMGLGKTVMVLALLARCRADRRDDSLRRPSLVVAPRSLVFNWRQESARFAPDLRVLDYSGSGRANLRGTIPDYDLVLTTYGTLRRDIAHLQSTPFEYVVLDESQAIKNSASASAKAVRLLTGEYRLALSGTPVENHVGELWSLFEFLNPGLLGSAAAFEGATSRRTTGEDGLAMLARGLRPFILRRTKEQVAPELPEKTEQTMYCELERPQRALYDELRDHYRRTLLARVNGDGLNRAKLQVLEALLRLRQAACHPGLIDPARATDASAKLDVLIPRLTEAVEEGHKTLVFSQFTSLLAIVRARLDEQRLPYEYLDGRTKDRQSRVERFQHDPECRLFLVSLKAGGVGLNLTAAEYVFLLDPWWNPAVEAQAIDRAHRIGQQRHVFAYRLIAKDTVEERVLELQQSKRALADAILTADEGLIRSLKKEDLELLLS